MENLPLELLELICGLLPLEDLASVSRCSMLFKNLATPMLYRSLDILMRSGIPNRKTSCVLQTLVRNISLHATFWTAGHSAFLNIILSEILDSSVQVKVFPALTSLRCTKIYSYKELDWIRWHLVNYIEHALENAQLRYLKSLRLELVDLSVFAKPVLSSVHALELNSCPGANIFLDRLAESRQKIGLKSLRLTGNIQPGTIYRFLFSLDSSSKLEELSLRIGSVTECLDIRKIYSSHPNLRILVLDFRESFKDPRSAIKYCLNDLQDIIRLFSSLEYLGLPLNIRDANFSKYKRENYTNSDVLQGSNLKLLHIRGCCVPMRRTLVDAKHIAKPFRQSGYFRVLLDHGSRLRKIVFGIKAQTFTSPNQLERYRLYTD
ncbi:hypothetical protein V8C42DRAFT_356291 [Trichoderma barbatum]